MHDYTAESDKELSEAFTASLGGKVIASVRRYSTEFFEGVELLFTDGTRYAFEDIACYGFTDKDTSGFIGV